MALEKLRVYNLLELIGRTAILLCVVVLVALIEMGVAGVLVAMLVGQAIVSVGGLAYLVAEARRRSQAVGPRRDELAALVTGGAKLHLNAIGTLLFTSAGILILNHYRGPSETAYYQLALQLMGAILIVPQAASMAMYGTITKLGPNLGWPMHWRVLWQTLVWISVLCVVAGVSAPLWVVALAGEPFRPVIEIFQWMLVGTIGMAFSTLMAAQWIGRGYFLQASLVTLIGGVFSLAANLLLVPEGGAMGAVHAYLIAAAYSVIVNGAFAIHCSKQASPS
jgi:O-antigen/teichoic acid export membrane protein